jgi:hypothetical protein
VAYCPAYEPGIHLQCVISEKLCASRLAESLGSYCIGVE